MKILTNCHDITYEVTTVANMYFAKEDEGLVKASSVFENGCFAAHCEIEYHDKVFTGDFAFPCDINAEDFERKRFLCAASAHATSEAARRAIYPKEVSLPWGLMLGIRPAKLVHEYVAHGYSYDAALTRLYTIYGLSEKKSRLLKTVAINENKLIESVPPNSISLYLGIPFCPTRCLYCSFVSTDMKYSKKYMEDYVTLLEKEIAYLGKLLKETDKSIESVYIGGGTPTSLSPSDLRRVLSSLYTSFDFSNLREFTVEAGRPDTITEEKLRALKEFPVDRISVNPQTMQDKTLELIGRRHTVEDVYKAYDMVRKITDLSINMDLIAGLPSEETTDFIDSLNKIISLGPDDVTVHTMSIKRGSRLGEEYKQHKLSKAKVAEDMLAYAQDTLMEKEYQPYYLYRQKNMIGNLENIGYAKSGHESFYNVNIMEEIQTILALGCGGVSKIVDANQGKISRVFNFKDPMEYISRFSEMLSRKEEAIEIMKKEG